MRTGADEMKHGLGSVLVCTQRAGVLHGIVPGTSVSVVDDSHFKALFDRKLVGLVAGVRLGFLLHIIKQTKDRILQHAGSPQFFARDHLGMDCSLL